MLRRTWQGARALARVRMLALHVRSLRLQALVAQRAGVDLRHDELGGRLEEGVVVALHCADHDPRRRGDEVGRQCGPSCASLPRRKGSTRSAKGEVEDRRRATGDVIDKVQQSKSNPRRTPMTLLSCSPRTTTRRGAVGESDGKSDDADSAASLNAACRLGERCFYGPPASELAGTRPRPSVPIRPKNHHVAPTPCHAAFRLSGAPAGGLEAGNPVLDVAPTGGSAAARIEGGEPACRVPACSPISNAHRTGGHVLG